jgi:hypothetical protein
MASLYRDIILEILQELGEVADPLIIEGWIRVEHRTLDALSRDQLKFEVETAIECQRFWALRNDGGTSPGVQ